MRDRDLADVRLLFDAVIAKCPATAEHLKINARIVHSPAFENGVVKILKDEQIVCAEEAALIRFAIDEPTKKCRNDKEDDFATLAFRQAKKPRHGPTQHYMDLLRVIPPTSNRCELLFSQCKLVMTSPRSRLMPANFEQITFLRANRTYWSGATLAGCVGEDDE